MPPRQPFNQGPRLTGRPSGDPAAQAIASLRGYAYQLYASGLAWLDLRQGEELYLEVAQDYAVAAGDALRAVQVKDTSAKVTINSKNIRDALDAFVDLVARNPGRKTKLCGGSFCGAFNGTAASSPSKECCVSWRMVFSAISSSGSNLPCGGSSSWQPWSTACF
jgi:hypothetical protein